MCSIQHLTFPLITQTEEQKKSDMKGARNRGCYEAQSVAFVLNNWAVKIVPDKLQSQQQRHTHTYKNTSMYAKCSLFAHADRELTLQPVAVHEYEWSE